MKGLRGLFRLGTLTLLALTLMVALALPTAAAGTCSSTRMLGEVEIVSVQAKESPAVWSARDLVNFDYDGDIENGLLEVKFKDIATDFDFDGYVIEAVPGDDDPGNSDDLGVAAYKSDSLIARPAVVGDTVTEVLNLEPGTKYYVTVHAVNHNTVQVSPSQRAQDSISDTTLLSAPFLGALRWHPSAGTVTGNEFTRTGLGTGSPRRCAPPWDTLTATCNYAWWEFGLGDTDFQGTHFAVYDVESEAKQHYFRWLNPAIYGPFDHIRDLKGKSTENKQADMLSLDKNNEVEDHCKDDDLGGDCGHTHYRFEARDEHGNVVASELVETGGKFNKSLFRTQPRVSVQYFRVLFTASDGDLTLSVTLGRKNGSTFRPMSDTASVRFDAPDELRALDQTYLEYEQVLTDLFKQYDENKELMRWLGESGSGADRSVWNPKAAQSFKEAFWGADQKVGGIWVSNTVDNTDDALGVLVAHLNNQLK